MFSTTTSFNTSIINNRIGEYFGEIQRILEARRQQLNPDFLIGLFSCEILDDFV
jgi:hypothetical protein